MAIPNPVKCVWEEFLRLITRKERRLRKWEEQSEKSLEDCKAGCQCLTSLYCSPAEDLAGDTGLEEQELEAQSTVHTYPRTRNYLLGEKLSMATFVAHWPQISYQIFLP